MQWKEGKNPPQNKTTDDGVYSWYQDLEPDHTHNPAPTK